ncbi:MAG: TAT-variant-translocated molybdopterin oxidoreductase [Candidatus Zixiibacteriota bacterium]
MPSLDHGDHVNGRAYWRSLDERAVSPEFRRFVEREFPEGASELSDPISRRRFLNLMGASLALAGLAGCRRPVEKVIPYVIPPEELVPGVPQFYATTMPLGTSAYGVVVESREGRPTKIEGNSLHPATRGRTNALLSASILSLYDPDRSSRVLERGAERTWDEFVVFWRTRLAHFRTRGGAGLAVLSEASTSPTLAALKAEFHRQFPEARWAAFEPVSDENIDAGIALATGRDLRPDYHYDRARVILSLAGDFLLTESESIAATAGFADGRRISSPQDEMNRLYVVEGGYSLTGTMADHRLRVTDGGMTAFVVALAAELATRGVVVAGVSESRNATDRFDRAWLGAVADDLVSNRGRSLVVAGRRQPPIIHALVYAINEALGNVGQTVEYREPVDVILPSNSQLMDLVGTMRHGEIETLAIIGGNPVYAAPADVDFGNALTKVAESIHLSPHVDETSQHCTWHIPRAHYLESWGDARAADGTAGVIQPLIEPLFNGRSEIELARVLVDGRDRRGYDLVRDTWQRLLPPADFDAAWHRVLHDGLLPGSGSPAVAASLDRDALTSALASEATGPADDGSLELLISPSATVYDGRFANNGWLQELPDPVTKLTWDNAAVVSPASARRLQVANQDVVSISRAGHSVDLPIWIIPGHADNCISLTLGYGRTACGRVGTGVGVNVAALRSASVGGVIRAQVAKTGRTYPVATTQNHWSMEGRPIVREATLEEFRAHPHFAAEAVEHPPLKSLWKEHSYDEGNQWGMAIDLNACTGCGACTVACQSENNIPIVGKEQVARGREMHWIRIDRYFSGDENNPEVVHQPMACQHCENAPCEQVCPVAATMHSQDGLNMMTYNRCIGTRYCSNNCPYKVRRFNFFNYTKDTPEVQRMAMNPDVTVRFRGVMEKCTYCVQRISRVRITAKDHDRAIVDGEIVTACQQACPAQAIVFGDVNDPNSKVSEMKRRQRRYEVLAELNVKPRTSYLAKLRNPNPKLA